MAALPDHTIEHVRSLYTQKEYSARMIAEELGVSLDAVYYAMRRYQIKRRGPSENSSILFKNKPLSYKLKQPLNREEKELKAVGVTLYWAEGYKTEKSNGIDFANSDVPANLIFMRFLREICGVDEKRIRIFLYCYADQQPDSLIQFWSEKLLIPTAQFTKPYIRSDFRVEKKGKMPYGLVHIRYGDKKLLRQVLNWIEEYKSKFCVGGRVVNYTTL